MSDAKNSSESSLRTTSDTVSSATLVFVAIFSIVLTLAVNFFTGLLPLNAVALCSQNISNLAATPGVELMGLPFVAFLVIMALQRIPSLRRYVTTSNSVYIYAITLAVTYFANLGYPWDTSVIAISGLATPDTFQMYLPGYVVAPKNVANLLQTTIGGTSSVPWVSIFPIIVWNFLLIALFGGMMVGIATIFRRQTIDVERLAFPQVMAAHACLTNIEGMNKPQWASKGPFLAGILIGVLLTVPLSGATLFPWFPDIYGWRANTCGTGSQRIAPPDVPWHLGVAKNFPVYALMMLVPVHDLFSVLFFTLVMEIAFFGSYYGLGSYLDYLSRGFCGRNWCGPDLYNAPPLYLNVINVGAMLGLFVAVIIPQRHYLLSTLRAAFGRPKNEEGIETNEPVSYRTSWIVLIGSFVMMVVFFLFTGISAWVSFILPLSGALTWFIMSQLWGRIGFALEPCYQLAPGLVKLFAWPTSPTPSPIATSTDLALVPTVIRWKCMTSYSGWGGSLYTTLGAYQMSSVTGVNPRSVLKVTLVAMFVAMFVTNFSAFLIPATLGWSNVRKGLSPINLEGIATGNFWSIPNVGAISNVSAYLIFGFIFMVVMRMLYARFLWLPNPLMAVVAWSWTISLQGVWAACLVAWVAKTLVLKIGGSKLYESKVVPLVGGFFLGTVLEILIATLTSFAVIAR